MSEIAAVSHACWPGCILGAHVHPENLGQASRGSEAASWPHLMKTVGVDRPQAKLGTHPNGGPEKTSRGRVVQEEGANRVSQRDDLWTTTGLCLGGRQR